MPAANPRFPGFPRALMGFFEDLGRHNERSWFESRRSDYEKLYVEPARGFVSAIGPKLAKLAPGVEAAPRVGGSIQRIHRDTRFSKDKTPYKTWLHFGFVPGKGEPGFFMRISPASFGIGAGLFGFQPDQLERYRAVVADPKRGAALQKTLAKAAKAWRYTPGEPQLKRVPRGLDPEHPHAELLRYKGLFAGRETKPPAALFGPKCVDFCLERFRELRPVQAWLVDALG